jgi:ankyrin repeat protein
VIYFFNVFSLLINDKQIKHGQIDVVKWSLNKTNRLLMDSQPNKLNPYQRSCLHLAAKHGECEILRFILGEMYKQQLLLDIQDINGNTAAHLAAKYNHLDCLQV